MNKPMNRTVFFRLNMILLILFIIPTFCMSSLPFQLKKGSGAPVDKNFKVSDFHGIDVSGGFDVILVQGNSEDLMLTAQENLFEHITVKVDQGILRIYTDNTIISTKSMKARISFKSIDNLKVSGGGDIACETSVNVQKLDVHISGGGDLNGVINTDKLTCQISGGGDAEINGNIKNYNLDLSGGGDVTSYIGAGIVDCNVSGGGDITLRVKEKASDAQVAISGGGDVTVELNAAKLKCSVSGGGDATLTGQASIFEIEVKGGGDVNAGNLLTETTSFNVSGGSDIHIQVSKELKGTISGGGNVYYSGNPANSSVDAKGGSKIYKE
jgi:hypothetical protein